MADPDPFTELLLSAFLLEPPLDRLVVDPDRFHQTRELALALGLPWPAVLGRVFDVHGHRLLLRPAGVIHAAHPAEGAARVTTVVLSYVGSLVGKHTTPELGRAVLALTRTYAVDGCAQALAADAAALVTAMGPQANTLPLSAVLTSVLCAEPLHTYTLRLMMWRERAKTPHAALERVLREHWGWVCTGLA